MSAPIDPALLDRARKAWDGMCSARWEGESYGPSPNYVCDGNKPYDLHTAIARALEEERKHWQAKEAEWLEFDDRDDLVNS